MTSTPQSAGGSSGATSVSVVIVSYRTGPVLWRCLDSALRAPEVGEVIVVDNGNPPATRERLAALAGTSARLSVLTGHGNVGFSAGCNRGAASTRLPFLMILNPDAILAPDAVGRLLAEGLAAGGDRPWLIGGKLLNPDGTEQAGARRRTLTPWVALVEMLRLDRLAPQHPYFRRFNQHEEPCPARTVSMPVISGACMLMPRADYERLGGMDEGYFLHAEDIDFCLRFGAAGGQVLYAPAAEVTHFKSSSQTSRVGVEVRKAQSLNRYFRRHFSGGVYPFGFLTLVSALVWLGVGARALRIGVGRGLALLGRRAATSTG